MATVIRTRLADISHWQPLITLALVKTHNIKGIAAKCTEGVNFFDPHYATNHSRTRSYGVPFWAYPFARPERSTADDAADYFLGRAHLQRGDRILMDAEASGLGQAATNAWLKRFATRCLDRAPINGRDIYLSGGYCGNGTGHGLAAYYEWLWYPRYRVTGWASSWNPGFSASWQDNTGFRPAPDVWQCADRPGFDRDVSWHPIDELTGGNDVALTQADIDKIAAASAKAVMAARVAPPTGYGYKNATYRADDFISGADAHAKRNGTAIAAVAKAVAAVAAKLGAVVDGKAIADAVIAQLDPEAIGAAVAASVQASGVVDEQAIAAAVADELGKRIEA